jgi:hypothetical protein
MLPSGSIERNQQAGFIGGTLTGFFVNISMADVFATILLSAIGAVVRFLVSMLMRRLLRGKNRDQPHLN